MTEKTFKVAKQELAKKNYAKAVKLFNLAYQEKPSFAANYYLAYTLNQLREYALSATVMREYLSEYIEDNEKFCFYLENLVKSGDAISAEQLLLELDPYLTEQERHIFTRLVKTTAKDFFSKNKISKDELLKKIRHLGMFKPFQQKTLLQQARCLTTTEYIAAITPLLTDMDVELLLRSDLLNELRKLDHHATVAYLNILDEVIKVNLAKLPSLDKTPLFQALQEDLQTIVGDDQLALVMLKGDLRLKLQLLYPLFEYHFSTREWHQLLNFPGSQELITNDEVKKIKAQLEKEIKVWQV